MGLASCRSKELAERARPLGWELSEDQGAALLGCLRALLDENRRLNLTAVRTEEEALDRLVLDSLALGLHIRDLGGAAVPGLLDLGTGGGVPGLCLACVLPDTRIHLVEARRRKLEAVERVARGQGLANVTCHLGRLDELLRRRPSPVPGSVEVVTARAVGPLGDLVAQAAPVLASGGILVCWKGDVADAERADGDRRARATGLVPLPDLPYRSYKPCRLVRYGRPRSHA